jgi:hypothetical protein
MALLMVMTVCVLVYAALASRIRRTLGVPLLRRDAYTP